MSRSQALLLAGLLAAVLALTLWRLRGPAPVPDDAAPDRFSALRAHGVLEGLLAERVPHPVGSRANAVVRDRIAALFRDMEYEVTIQRAFVCNRRVTCATVENIVALPPESSDELVLGVAHYDSVPAGAGASDDGAGVAALLEVARALRNDVRRQSIGFVITDGEEAGLLGAEALVARQFPKRIRAIVNVEHRGTSGPSYLFETSPDNLNLVRTATSAMAMPFASSLFYTVYDRMPNDTDVTVFKRAKLRCLNFAAIGGFSAYHTPLDDIENVNLRTLQHHGDNALATLRALVREPLDANGNAVYFDVLGFFVVQWPERWTLWMAVASALLLVIGTFAGRGRLSLTGVVRSFLLFAAIVLSAACAGSALMLLAHIRAGDALLAFPQAAIAAMWLSGLALPMLFGTAIRSRHDARSVFTGVAAAWHAAAIIVTWTLPGLSYLFLVPAIVLALGAITRFRVTASFAAALAAAILFFPVAVVLYTALGKVALVAIAAVVAIVSTTFVSESVRLQKRAFTALVAAVLLAGFTNLLPVHTERHPRRASLTHELRAPTVQASAMRSDDMVTLSVSSSRRVNRLSVRFDRDVIVETVNGVRPAAASKTNTVVVYGTHAVVAIRARGPLSATVTDITYGVPAEIAAGRGPNEVPSHAGDLTVSRRKVAM